MQTDVEELGQGANLEVEYTYVIRNTGEEDYISKDLADSYKNNQAEYSAELAKKGRELKDSLKRTTHNYGKKLGTYYYTGNKGRTDVQVTSKVEELGEALNNKLRYDENTAGGFFTQVNTEKVEKNIYNTDGKIEKEAIDTVIKTTRASSLLTKGEPDTTKTLKLTTVLSSLNLDEVENISSYIAEILKYSSASGARNTASTPDNLTYVHSKDTQKTMENSNEGDEFWGETIRISKPTGENKILPVQIGVTALVVTATIGMGIVLIKKFVLTK